MPWIAAIATVAAAASSAKGAKASAAASAQATRESTAENRRQHDIARQDTALSRSVGESALYRLANTFGIGMQNQSGGLRKKAALNKLERTRTSLLDRISRAENNQDVPKPETLAEYGYDNVEDWLNTMRGRLDKVDSRMLALSSRSGRGTVGRGEGLYQNLEMDPGYEFRLAENEKALQRMQSAGGTRYGGGALKAALRYGQDYASNEFSNAVNRRNAEIGYLFSLAGFGQQGIATAAQAGANSASNNSNILMQNAALQGNAAMTRASGINNAIQGGLQSYYTHQLLNNYNQTPTTTDESSGAQPQTDWNYNY